MLVREKKLAHIEVRGVVQGVGFRPFVYRLAKKYDLKGWVRNTSGSVAIEIEGNDSDIQGFLKELKVEAPPLAHIEDIKTLFLPPSGLSTFEIRHSLSETEKYQLVSPDIATCPDCRQEIFAADDRRFRYPFTNCTNCGPRFTIIQDIPYDRPNTTMRKFTMCPTCQSEFGDPLNRRFHAQPNACPVCGPGLELVDSEGNPVISGDRIKDFVFLLRQGKILAIKGLGGFQLACDATNEQSVNLLRERKRRLSKPFAVMFATIEEIERNCFVSPEERSLLKSPQCPIVLLRWKNECSSICAAVAPNLKSLGVMLPYTPLHHILLRETGMPLVMTSGNLSEEPIAADNEEALRRLKGIADYFLLHNRDIYARYDDSVYIVEDGQPRAVRRARGYAPYPIPLPFKSAQILACGGEEKNTFCLTRDEHAFLSQHIGDMENAETLEHYENTIELYKKLFRINPEVIAYDMHPEYLSTKYALKLGEQSKVKLVPVQHHHAHIVSCMVENSVTEPVLGVAFDGTGYGTDGAIWGGEFLLADFKGFKRLGHLDYISLPGGASAIKKPYRMALSYLFSLLGEDFPLKGLHLYNIDPTELDILKCQIKGKINSPLTSSAGRLFDAVSALVGVRQEIDYEAQAAIELEMQSPDEYDKLNVSYYPFYIVEDQEIKVVKLGELVATVVKDIKRRVPVPEISLKFHCTIAKIITQICQLLSEEIGIRQVALSGGVFQNRLLFKLTLDSLQKNGFKVVTHRLVPCNDGGISLGQAVIAHYIVR